MIAPRSELGQTTILVLGLALVCFAVAGVAIDGTRAFLMRRTLQNAADAAALAGAGEVDRRAYYRSSGRNATLDLAAARGTAAEWIGRRGLVVTSSIGVAPSGVRVTLRSEVPTTFLRLVGVARIPVAASARARPMAGGP